MVDGFWNYVEKKNNGFACKFCEFEFAARTSVTRIKSHLSGIKGLGVSICNRVPDDVKEAACLAIQGGKKRRKPMSSSSNDVLVPNPERDVEMTPMAAQRLHQLVEGGNLSGIEIGNWVDSMIGGEIVIIDQGRAPEVSEAHPAKGKAFQTTELVGRAFERNISEIWSWLMKDDVLSIGVYGIGGVGKTSLLRHINDQLLQRPSSFQNVFWITVTQDFSIYKLQNLIAKAVDLDLSNDEDEKKRAVKLSNGLIAKKKFVLILDDLWNHFSPEKVGVPVGVDGCKLILTSRSLRVCRQMCCQEKIKVEPLSEDEAWTLFMEKLGLNVELPSEVIEIAKSVAKECTGLPLWIITMAGSMRQVDDIGQWRNALEKLKEKKIGKGDMEADIFKIIEFSYMNLNDSALQQAFLYCALFPVDSGISREDLVEYMIVEGIVAKRKSRQAESDKGAMLNKLENACLIESCTREGYRCVRMNTLVRDMAIKIQKVNSQAMVESGAQLEKLPDIEKWTEDLVRVSLMKNYITEIPASYSPRCPNLSTLLLSQNYMLRSIGGSFFTQLNGLAVLDLSNTGIKSLPGSISNLVCLTTLLLRRCQQLRQVPTLAKLTALKKLDLVYTQLEELPEGMKLLSNLRYLDLSHTRLKQLSAGILPKLCRLQVLRVLLSSETQVTLKGEEVACLKRLEALECNFCDLIEFSKYVKSWEDTQPPRAYYFIVGPAVPSLSGIHKTELNNTVRLCNCSINIEADLVTLPKTIQALEIVQCHDMTSLCAVSSMKHAIKLKSLVIWDCNGIECLLSLSSISADTLQSLETLCLSSLKNLCGLFSRQRAPPPPFPSNGTFSSLKTCKIFGCPSMKELFPAGVLPNLQNLEVIEVVNCNKMETIIAGGGGGIMSEESNFSLSNTSAVSSTDISLWKPMVEEMYMEEIKEQEQNGSEDKTSKSEHNEDAASRSVLQEKGSVNGNQTRSFKSLDNSPDAPSAISIPTSSTSPVGGNLRNQSGFSFMGSSELDGITQGSPKKPRSHDLIQSPTSVPSINMDIKPGEANNEQVSMKFGDERQSRDGYSFMGGQTNFIGGFGQYPMGEIGRFDGEQFTPRFSGNGVSLTLGLPHCENLSLSGTHQTFLPNQNIQLGRRVEIGEPNEYGALNTSTPHSSTAYESIDIQNRKRFIAQLLPDFVA